MILTVCQACGVVHLSDGRDANGFKHDSGCPVEIEESTPEHPCPRCKSVPHAADCPELNQ